MRIAIHAGHNPDGKVACGAIGYIKESTVARQIKDSLKSILRSQGHEVWDATVENGTSQSNILKTICNSTNTFHPDIALSIHLNASDNPQANGVECWVHTTTTMDNVNMAREITAKISAECGMRARELRYSNKLYVLNHIDCPVILIECGFVTSHIDAEILDPNRIARSIASVFGIVDTIPETGEVDSDIDPNVTEGGVMYRVQIGAFRSKTNAVKLAEELERKGYDTFITKV